MSGLECDVCGGEAVGVACGACGPVSFGYCQECLTLGAEPFGYLAVYLGSGGLVTRADVRPEYYPIIEATCKRAGKTEAEFWALVSEIAEDVCNQPAPDPAGDMPDIS